MNQLINMTSSQTMTSKELVEVINVIRKQEGNDIEIEHSDLMRRIRGLEQYLPARSVTGDKYLGKNGQIQPMLLLTKEASLLTVSSESPKINLAIIRRWQELEAQQRPLTYLEALKELVAKEEENQRIQIENLQKTVALDHKKAITNDGNTYFTIARIKELNQGVKLSGSRLSRESDDQELPPIKQNAMYGITTPYAYHKEVWEAVYPDIVLPD